MSTLIVAEKPNAALRIVKALTHNQFEKKEYKGISYYVGRWNGRKVFVVPALGHLYTVTHATGTRSEYPIFNIRWAPRHKVERGVSHVEKWIQLFKKLSSKVEEFICACDYDIEGSVIGYNILKYACGNVINKSKRAKFSTLTVKELKRAFDNLMPTLDFSNIEAGLCRHEIDFLYGVNVTRAFTNAVNKATGRYFVLSVGRVQTPTLKILVDRERRIRSFVPLPFWRIKTKVEISGVTLEAEFYKSKLESVEEANRIVEACRGREGNVHDVKVRMVKLPSPPPFSLGDLQSEAYKFFRYTPRRTLAIAESLYLSSAISYPRTSSQQVPDTIDCKEILQGLSKVEAYRELTSKLLSLGNFKPAKGPKSDPAHPAIIPTGELPDRPLDQAEEKLYDLIVKRFLASMGEPAERRVITAEIKVGEYTFRLRGYRTIRRGWLEFYQPYMKLVEEDLPEINRGDGVKILSIDVEENYTKPPFRFNPARLVRFMEELNIGTKATRAEIIDILYRRNYVRGDRIEVTDLGFTISEAIEEFCPILASIDLTRKLEKSMDLIVEGKLTRKEVVSEAVELLKPIIAELKQNSPVLGRELAGKVKSAIFQKRVVGRCPICDSGFLIILRSRRTGKRFIGCTGYFKGLCNASFPLPQKGRVTPTGKACSRCGWPTVKIQISGRRIWILCFNPECGGGRVGEKKMYTVRQKSY